MTAANRSGATQARRFVIFNADDLGYSDGINRGIMEAHERGVVTSASLMVNTPATQGAARWARDVPRLSVGLHVNFTNEEERLVAFEDPKVVQRELRAQIDRFQDVMGRPPTHLDSHQHVHRLPECRPVFEQIARERSLHLRDAPPVAYKGGFYGQWVHGQSDPAKTDLAALAAILRNEVTGGIYEICVHPGYVDPSFTSVYHEDRVRELATLTHPSLRGLIASMGIGLASYHDLPHIARELGIPWATAENAHSDLVLDVLPDTYCICRLPPQAPLPSRPKTCDLFSVTCTPEETSVVCREQDAPEPARTERGWRCLRVRGPLDFSMVGVLSRLSAALAQAGISVFALSTFDTDYLMVGSAFLSGACEALARAGIIVNG